MCEQHRPLHVLCCVIDSRVSPANLCFIAERSCVLAALSAELFMSTLPSLIAYVANAKPRLPWKNHEKKKKGKKEKKSNHHLKIPPLTMTACGTGLRYNSYDR